MVSYNGKKIIYTFKYGKSFEDAKRWQVVFIIVGSSVFILIGITAFIIMFINNDEDAWSGFLFCSFGVAFIVVLLIWFFVKRKREKEICKWLTDEKLFESKGYPWEFSKAGGAPFSPAGYRFGIDFKKHGHSYRKMSLKYDRFFKKVEGTKITVLYSPEYDQVMVVEKTE